MFVQTAFQDQAHGLIGAVALLGAATAVGQRALATERGQRLRGQRLPSRLKERVQHMPDRFKSGAARLKRGEHTLGLQTASLRGHRRFAACPSPP